MQIAIQQQPGQVRPMQRLNALAVAAGEPARIQDNITAPPEH